MPDTLVIPLPEVIVAGRRLGRHVNHDPRSLAYQLPAAERTDVSVEWPRHTQILDQGSLGSCTGNAVTGALGTGPLWDGLADLLASGLKLDETLAKKMYSDAEILDGGKGLPSEDQGSSGLSVANVAATDGYIAGYQHATSIAAAHTAIQAGPFIQGTVWMDGMDSPSSEGIVKPTGQPRGGHEYLCRQYDATRDLWWYDNSWGTGFGVQGRFAMDTASLTKLLAQQGDITSLVPRHAVPPVPTPAGTTYHLSAEQAAEVQAWAAERHYGENGRIATIFRTVPRGIRWWTR